MDENRAQRVVDALRARGINAHMAKEGTYQIGVRVDLPDGRQAVWDSDDTAELELVYRGSDEGLVIEGSCPSTGGAPDPHPVARELLAMTADEYSLAAADGVVSFRLLKRRQVASG